MKKIAILMMIALASLGLAGCNNNPTDETDQYTGDVSTGDEQNNDTDTEEMTETGDAQDGETETGNDEDITDEDVKMIEDFLNEVIDSVEGEGAQ